MKRYAVLLTLIVAAACASHTAGTGGSSLPGHGAIAVQITPNPIVAHQISGSDTFDFPFDVIVRETAGHPLTVRNITADVYALGGFHVDSETYDAAKIRSLGYPTSIPANGELRYHLDPRKSVSDPSLFSGVSADVRVDAVDETGTATSAHVSVTIVKG